MEVVICYWYADHSTKTGYARNEKLPIGKLHEAIDKVLAAGLDLMLSHLENGNVLLAVDDQRFQKR